MFTNSDMGKIEHFWWARWLPCYPLTSLLARFVSPGFQPSSLQQCLFQTPSCAPSMPAVKNEALVASDVMLHVKDTLSL
jgi:hypothetical protein